MTSGVNDSGASWALTNADTAFSGLFQLDNTAAFDVATALGTNTQISFASGSDLGITDTSTFGIGAGSTAYAGPLLESFGGSDSIDLKNFSAIGAIATLDTASDLLQLTNSETQVATLSFQGPSLGSGTFQVASDHATGALLTLN